MIVSNLIEKFIPYATSFLELMGILIIMVTAVKAFAQYTIRAFSFRDDTIKIELAKSLALALEFILAGEILMTILLRDLTEVVVLAAIMGIRILLTLVIHWEIHSDLKSCNEFLHLKETELNEKKNREIPLNAVS